MSRPSTNRANSRDGGNDITPQPSASTQARAKVVGKPFQPGYDPRRVIAHLPDPFMSPNDLEREGYVPNVLYSCGAMVHNDQLILPYGFSDLGTGIALVPLNDLLALLLEHRCDE